MWYFKVAIFDHKALAISIALGMLRSLPLSIKLITLIEKTTYFQTLINANQFPANRIEFRIGAKVIWTFVKRKNSAHRPAFVYIYLYIRLFYFLFYAILFFRLFWSGASETVKKRLWLLLRWFYGFDLIFVFIAHACVRLSFLIKMSPPPSRLATCDLWLGDSRTAIPKSQQQQGSFGPHERQWAQRLHFCWSKGAWHLKILNRMRYTTARGELVNQRLQTRVSQRTTGTVGNILWGSLCQLIVLGRLAGSQFSIA